MTVDDNKAGALPKGYVFITGTYRSGTTLLHHLFDGHGDLLAFPVESCLFRDYFFYSRFPHPDKRRIAGLRELIASGDVDAILDVVFSNDKLALPLTGAIVLEESTGDQVVETSFDRDAFTRHFKGVLDGALERGGALDVMDLFIAYNESYFVAIGKGGGKGGGEGGAPGKEEKYYVNKCPEQGYCIDYYLEKFASARVIHIVRDPRAVMASHKARLPQEAYLAHGYFFQLMGLVNDSMVKGKAFAANERVHLLRYEDLVSDPALEMSRIADFLEISNDASLVMPSVSGVPWRSNTSFDSKEKGRTGLYKPDLKRYMKKLNTLEIECVESVMGESMERYGYERVRPSKRLAGLKRSHMFRSLYSRLCRRIFGGS